MPQPVIGITCSYNANDRLANLALAYYRSVNRAGGTAVIIPPQQLQDEEFLSRIDGLILSGGGDILPSLFGEEKHPSVSGIDEVRDRMEIQLARRAYEMNIPILGICKGVQILNVALGGTLYQDINSIKQFDGSPMHNHSQKGAKWETDHIVSIEEDSILYELFKVTELEVNSFHHQAVKTPAKVLRVTARSADGIIEALESTEHKSILGLQWHPEGFVLLDEPSLVSRPSSLVSTYMLPVFDWLIREALSYRCAKEVHKHFISLDSHCDTPMIFDDACLNSTHNTENLWNIAIRNPLTLVDIPKMTDGCLDATIMVAYLKQLQRDEESLHRATEKTNRILDHIEKMVTEANACIAHTPHELLINKMKGKKSIMMGIENGYAIGNDISNIEHFRNRGVVYMTLCHNGDNDICDSAKGNQEHNGVSDFGEKVICEMNRTGMLVDLSHASEKSFYDALEISSMPIVCSHSSSKALCNHPRNLTDDQMRALARRGGVAQVTLYDGFLRQGGGASIDDVMLHLNHMVDVMGVEHVGIGTDFDGDGGVNGLMNAADLINLTRRMLADRYSEKDLELLWGGNFLRVMNKVQMQ